MIDPANVLIADDLRIMTGYTIVPAIASEEDIVGAIGKLNRLDHQVTAANDLSVGGEDEITDIREMTEEPPIVKLVNLVIAQSVDDAASDIHFEPQAKDLLNCASASTACCTRSCRCRAACRTGSSAGSKSWPSSTSPSAACRKTGA